MKVAIIIDDPIGVDYFLKQLQNPEEIEGFSGMRCYTGMYKNKSVNLFFFQNNQDSFSLRAEDLFVFMDFDVLINVGYCYSLDRSLFDSGDLVFLGNVKCDDDYRDIISLNDFFVKYYELDKKIERKIFEVSKRLEIPVVGASCFSSTSLLNKRIPGVKPLAPLVDLKAFSLYETASIHNRHALCLYVVKSIDFHDSEMLFDNLNRLSLVSLEVLHKCSQ